MKSDLHASDRDWTKPSSWTGAEFRTATLEKIKFSLHTYVSKELAEEFATIPNWEIETSSVWRFWDNIIAVNIRGFIYGEHLKIKTIEYPRDWWQHFKERWFPEWAKRRWPVEYRTEKLEAKALYPKVSFPDNVPVIRIAKYVDGRELWATQN